VHCRIQISPPIVPAVDHLNTCHGHIFFLYVLKINLHTKHAFQMVASFKLSRQKSLCISLLSYRPTCPVHLNLPDFIILTLFSEDYTSWSSSLSIFLQSPVTLQIDSSTPCPNAPNRAYPSVNVRDQIFFPKKQQTTKFHAEFYIIHFI
jgi:hypothetical protein